MNNACVLKTDFGRKIWKKLKKIDHINCRSRTKSLFQSYTRSFFKTANRIKLGQKKAQTKSVEFEYSYFIKKYFGSSVKFWFI